MILVSLLIKNVHRKNVVGVKRIEDHMSIKVIAGKDTINAYAPQVGAKSHLKRQF